MTCSFPALLVIVLATGTHGTTPRKALLHSISGRRFTYNTVMVLVLRARYTRMMSLLLVIRSVCAVRSPFRVTNSILPRLRTRHSARPLATRLALPSPDGNQTDFSGWVSLASRATELLLSSAILSLRVFYLPILLDSPQRSCTLVELTANFTRATSPMCLSPKRYGCVKSAYDSVLIITYFRATGRSTSMVYISAGSESPAPSMRSLTVVLL